jgi:hypothetical protein
MLFLCAKLNEETNKERTIKGMPISGVWLTCPPQHKNVHCDKNVVGSTFLFTTKDVAWGKLMMAFPTRKVGAYQVNTQEVIAGKWGEFPHCNAVNSNNVRECPTSWTVCLDYRLFGKTWNFVFSKGHTH